MKILHFCMNAPFAENYSYQDNLLTEYQHKLGHNVRIVTSTRTRDENGKIVNTSTGFKVLDNGVELVRIEVKGKLRLMLGWYAGILPLIQEYQPDLIFVHGLCSFIPRDALKYKKLYNKNVRIVADNHQDRGTTIVSGFPFSTIMSLHRRCWKKWISGIDKVYGTTSWRKTFAEKYYGIPCEKCEVLIMGVDTDRIKKDWKFWRDTVKQKLGIPESDFVFITGGKLDNRKKILESMRAFHKTNEPYTRFLIFGSVDKEIKAEFETIISSDPRIIYIGYIDSNDVWKYFYAADFGVFAGRHSVLWEEAIGCGLPCLFHRYEERDHTEVCGNCICIKEDTVEAVYEVLLKILSDKTYYDIIKANAVRASEKFSYYSIAEKSLECCECY